MKSMNGGDIKVDQPVSRKMLFILLGATLILSAPLLAMQFTDHVNWDLFDFAVAGALLVGAGVVYVLSARLVRNARYRVVLAVALGAALFLVWAELAVGVFGTPLAGT